MQYIYKTDSTYPSNGAGYISGVTSDVADPDYYNLIPTGVVEDYEVNNIYDMNGNVSEWTMEGWYVEISGQIMNYGRVRRGNDYFDGEAGSPQYRELVDPVMLNSTCGPWTGFRVSLYLV